MGLANQRVPEHRNSTSLNVIMDTSIDALGRVVLPSTSGGFTDIQSREAPTLKHLRPWIAEKKKLDKKK